jgi:hypothetical protein
LDRHLSELIRNRYKVLYQSDATAQVSRKKRASKGTIFPLAIISIFAFFIPIFIYLIFFADRTEISVVTVDEYGRLSQTVTQK